MSARRSVAWAFAGQIVSILIGFGASIALARLLSPAEIGLNALATATMGILSVITTSGAAALIVREPKVSRELLDAATSVNALLSVGLIVALLLLAEGAAPILGDPRTARVLRILALLPLFGVVTFRPAAMMQRDMQFRGLAVIGGIAAAIAALTSLALAMTGHGYRSPSIGAVAGAVAGVGLYGWWRPDQILPRFGRRGARRVAVFGLQMMSVSGVGAFVTYFSDAVLGRLLGVAALGYYSRASLLANALYGNVYGTATRVAFAELSRSFRETGALAGSFMTSFRSITAVMWPLAAGVALLSRPVISHLFGARWLPAAAPLSILMAAQMLTLSFGMNWELFVLRDRLAEQTRFELIRSVIGLVVFIAGCMISITVAALGRVVDAAIGAIIYFRYMSELSGISRREIWRIYGESALLTLAAATPAALAVAASGDSALLGWGPLVAAAAAGLMMWLTVLWRVDHPLFAELRRIASRGANTLRPAGGA